MHGDNPVSLRVELAGYPRIFESDKGETIAVGIGKRDLGAVVLIALLAAVDQDAVLRHLGHERLPSVDGDRASSNR